MKILSSTLCSLCFLLSFASTSSCATKLEKPAPKKDLIVLDVGHGSRDGGATTPSAINGRRLNEYDFWYKYSYYTKQEIEKGGYQCMVINRGDAPTASYLQDSVAKGHVLSLGKPDSSKLGRYASKYSPDRIGLGMISADYALEQNPACVVFLHHNTSGNSWQTGASSSIMMCNKYNGVAMAQCFCDYFNQHIFNQEGGIDNKGRAATVMPRSAFALGGAGWLNVLDDAGIPAVVVEMAFLNNRNHVDYLSQEAKAIEYAQAVGRAAILYMDTQYQNCPHHKRLDFNKADEGSATHQRLER